MIRLVPWVTCLASGRRDWAQEPPLPSGGGPPFDGAPGAVRSRCPGWRAGLDVTRAEFFPDQEAAASDVDADLGARGWSFLAGVALQVHRNRTIPPYLPSWRVGKVGPCTPLRHGPPATEQHAGGFVHPPASPQPHHAAVVAHADVVAVADSDPPSKQRADRAPCRPWCAGPRGPMAGSRDPCRTAGSAWRYPARSNAADF